MDFKKKLYRSQDKMLAGVCAGLAHYFNIDVTLTRVLYAVATALTGGVPGLILYVALIVIMPLEPTQQA